MKRGAILGLAVAALMAPLSASGAQQSWTGSRIAGAPPAAGLSGIGSSDTQVQASVAALAMGRAVAGCMVKRHDDMVVAFLASSPTNPGKPLREDMKDALRGCLIEAGPQFDSSQMRFNDDTLRGLFAEAWLLSAETAPSGSVADAKPDYTARWISGEADQSVVDRMALCLTSAHPAEAVALVRSASGSAAESSALAALSPYFGGCLVKDATLKINRNGVRLAVAKAVYYRDHMAGAAPALAGKN